MLVAGKENNVVKVEDDDDGLFMTPLLKERLRSARAKKMGGDYSLVDNTFPKEKNGKLILTLCL